MQNIFQRARPFLALIVFLLFVIPLLSVLNLTQGLNTEQALTFFLPGFFVCFGYYVANTTSFITKK